MNRKIFIPVVFIVSACSCSHNSKHKEEATAQRLPVKCSENSPERQGKEGCTILANRPLVGSLSDEAYWHIDKFESNVDAQKAAGPNSVAAEAHGAFWLLTVEPRLSAHNHSSHIASIGPINPPGAKSLMMRVQSSILSPGSTTPPHRHSGPEVIYIVDGEQCMETTELGNRIGAGESLIVPTGGIHRGTVSGPNMRKAIALILYDADRPASSDLGDATSLVECK